MPCKNSIAYEESNSFLCISKRIKIISSYSHSYLTSGFSLITAGRQHYKPSYFAATSLMLFCIMRPPEDTGIFATKSPFTTTFLSLTMDYLLSRLSITSPYLYNTSRFNRGITANVFFIQLKFDMIALTISILTV